MTANRRILVWLLCCFLIISAAGCGPKKEETKQPGQLALEHIKALDKIGSRPTGSENNQKALEYINGVMQKLGYQTNVHDFGYVDPESLLPIIHEYEYETDGDTDEGAESDEGEAEATAPPGDMPKTDKVASSPETAAEGETADGESADGEAELDLTPSEEMEASEPTPAPIIGDGKNLICIKPGRTERLIILGAHMDSADGPGNGADDNASGVAALLELADRLRDVQLESTLVFAFFDAEELGVQGSYSYLSNLTDEQFANIQMMINVDSIMAGDHLYVYGGSGPDGWLRERALEIAQEIGVDLRTSPGTGTYAKGTTGDWSDHKHFRLHGFSFAYFEATNWALGAQDGMSQTEKEGTVFHTERDTYEHLEKMYPNRAQKNISDTCAVIENLLRYME